MKLEPITIDGNFVLSCLSLVLIVISIVVAVKTLRQNNKMIEAGTRPYVVMKCEATHFNGERFYLMVKNYGQAGAVIDSIETDVDLREWACDEKHIPFAEIEGTLLAPGQSLFCVLDYLDIRARGCLKINFTIRYHSASKKYSESYPIDLGVYSTLVYANADVKGKEPEAIAHTLQSVVERML